MKSLSRFLRQINEWEAAEPVALFIDCEEEDSLFTQETYWIGLVSGKSYCCLHESALPTSAFFRAVEQQEVEFVNHTGARLQ